MAKRRNGRRRRLAVLVVLMVVLIGYGVVVWRLPTPILQPTTTVLPITSPDNLQSSITWPTFGEAAIGSPGQGILAIHGAQVAVPTASTAKLITALAVLSQKPLQVGEQGPIITLGPSDVDLYTTYLQEDGSVVPVTAGEQISEYEMLEAMMLPSANNMADSLAIWAFGSLSAYRTYAQTYAQSLGLKDTTIGTDASGFSPTTTSTASDLVRLGEAAINNPVLAAIVKQSSVQGIPDDPVMKNVNSLLGVDNIDGIKTGNSDQAGGVFVSASTTSVGSKQLTLVTAVANAPDLSDALDGSLPMIVSAQQNFAVVKVGSTQAVVGLYHVPWAQNVGAIMSAPLTTNIWKGTVLDPITRLSAVKAGTPDGQTVGSVRLANAAGVTTTVRLQATIPKPSLWWRLRHP